MLMVVDPTAGILPTPRLGWAWLAKWVLIPLVLGGLVFAQTRLFRNSTSETYDGYTYLRVGVRVDQHGDFESLASPMDPPLPILLEYWLPALRAQFVPGTDAWQREVPAMTNQARLLTSVTLGIPLVLLVYAWIGRRRGWVVGALGGALVAFSPTILAAASIAATDGCFALFGVVGVAALHFHAVRRTRWSYVVAGLGIGLALAAKQTAVILLVVALGELLIEGPAPRSPGGTRTDVVLQFLGWVGVRLAGLIALAFVVDWSCYGFRTGRYGSTGAWSTLPVIIPMVANLFPNGEAITEAVQHAGAPLAFLTFVGQMDHASQGHAAFLMGDHSSVGWWYYFPVALAIKSTPAELVMMALVACLACRPATWRDPAQRIWIGSSLVMLGAGMTSSINIGQRYMILVYPLVILSAVDWLGAAAQHHRFRAIGAAALLLAWQCTSAVGIAPHYLSYFNSLCGGPLEGYRYLVDSNLDWGQDLPVLRRALEARNYRRVALGYFGTAQAATYGLRAVDWKSVNDADAATCDWLAISATVLQEAYGGTQATSNRFQDLPSTRVGYTFFLYNPQDPRVRAAWDVIRQPGSRRIGRPGEPEH